MPRRQNVQPRRPLPPRFDRTVRPAPAVPPFAGGKPVRRKQPPQFNRGR